MRSTVAYSAPQRTTASSLHYRRHTSSRNLFSGKKAEKWVKNLENGKKVVNLQCK